VVYRKRYIVVALCGGVFAAVLAMGASIHHIWRSTYSALGMTIVPVELPGYYLSLAVDRLVRPIIQSNKPGLPPVRIYIPERSQRALMKELPENLRQWQKGYLYNREGNLQRVKIRHRGDNPVNWAFAKKSWRVKTRRKELIDKARVFNYIVAQDNGEYVSSYLSYYIAQVAGLNVPKTRVVELFVNDLSHGIFMELEQLDENFLRSRNIMPVNLYKGEQGNREAKLLVNNFLFDNPFHWSKLATFNHLELDNRDDMARFLNLVREAETSTKAFDQLKRMARIEDWAKFAAYQTLAQNGHYSGYGNLRLISDPWRGTISPVVYDARFSSFSTFDFTSHQLINFYSKSSQFQMEKLRILKGFLDKGVLSKASEHLRNLIPALKNTYSRDNFRSMLAFTNDFPLSDVFQASTYQRWLKLVDEIDQLEGVLRQKIANPIDLSWRNARDGAGLAFVIDGFMPADEISISMEKEFESSAEREASIIAWDKDGNGYLSAGDVHLPFDVVNGKIIIQAKIFANRNTSRKSNRLGAISGGTLKQVPTEFRLVSDQPMSVTHVTVKNTFTNAVTAAPMTLRRGVTPSGYNIPLVATAKSSAETWSGIVEIDEAKILMNPVIIKPGTHLRMGPKGSVVFRSQLFVNGTAEDPVKVESLIPGKKWGTFALHGIDNKGSEINHLSMRGGSGALIAGVHYIGMLSVHESEDVVFRQLSLAQNHDYDDMMHVIYSKKVRIEGCELKDARSDALDVDISEISIQSCNIMGAGNDAIDLMSTTASISNSMISQSGDKGISVGEGSSVNVQNTKFVKNNNGIVSKDGSQANVMKSEFVRNNVQIDAYQKNWRYADGGRVVVENSKMIGTRNIIKADKKSSVQIRSSNIMPSIKTSNPNILIEPPGN
jgi:hypothetical protein